MCLDSAATPDVKAQSGWTMSPEKSERGQARREVLKALVAGGLAAGTALTSTDAEAHFGRHRRRPATVLVFRFTTRNRRTCTACQNHHRYVVGSSHALLQDHRAHPGCNCPIVLQEITRAEFRRFFPGGEGVVDLRKLRRKKRRP